MSYVACQMATVERTHQPCVEAFGVSFNEILQCVESEFATRQQLEFEQITRESFLLLLVARAKTSSTVETLFSSFLLCSAGFGAHQLGADDRLQRKDYRIFAHWPRTTAQRDPLRFHSQHESGLRAEKAILRRQWWKLPWKVMRFEWNKGERWLKSFGLEIL
jgi:hypothetical protein